MIKVENPFMVLILAGMYYIFHQLYNVGYRFLVDAL